MNSSDTNYENDENTNSICFLRDTQINMADGTTASIQHVKAGDITAAGCVLDTVVHVVPNTQRTSEIIAFGEQDLHVYDGVEVLGTHIVLEQGNWLTVARSWYGVPRRKEGNLVFFNLLIESGIVPVRGESGRTHYFADLRNNQSREAEMGLIKVSLLHPA